MSVDVASRSLRHSIFVYGTLKRGLTNYQRYLGVAERYGKAAFVGTATTLDAFPLVVRPPHMLPATCGPVLTDKAGSGHRIHGELFRLDDETLEAMDILEGVRSGLYYKRKLSVCLNENENFVCHAYFYPAKEELLALTPFQSYMADHHDAYRPGPVNEEILRLCQASHGLCTLKPSNVLTHCVRLLPGDDLVPSLRAFARSRQLNAAVILSCVGSTSRTTLRPAGVKTPRVFEGKYEIVSLTGTLSTDGHHLHMSISDESCNVFGGHVLEGCIVRTTAEIALGVIEGVSFTRPLDSRTGYDELSILPTEEANAKRQRTEEP